MMCVLQSESSEDNSPEVARNPCVQEVSHCTLISCTICSFGNGSRHYYSLYECLDSPVPSVPLKD